MKNKKISLNGFTLIELLVVVAIIGILASVVVASLADVKVKTGNTAVISNLNNLRAQAEIFFNEHANYNNLCDDSRFILGFTAASNAGVGATPVCNSTTEAWAVSVQLREAEGTLSHWCVDSTNASRGETALLSAGILLCP